MKSTEELIQGMKAQTFGVEVEGNNITREQAAKVAAGYFGTNHYANTASVDGYYTWSAWDQQGRKWKFQRDVSIKGPDDEKCELVTPILTYDDMEMFLELRSAHPCRAEWAGRPGSRCKEPAEPGQYDGRA